MSKRLNILIDANPLASKKTGIGHFTYRLIEGLSAQNDLNITAYYFNFLGRKSVPDLPRTDVVTYKVVRFWPTKITNILHRFRLQLPLEFFIGPERYDFLLFPNFVAVPSLHKTPFGCVIHDLGFIDCPEYVSDPNRVYLERFVKRTIDRSSLVTTISEFTKKRIVDTYGVQPDNILVMPIPYEPVNPHGGVSNKIKELAKKPYILYVGTLEPRKNIAGLVEAFAKTKQSTREKYQLVLAGGWGWKTEGIKEAIEKYKDSISLVLPGYISDAEKEFLYQHAELVCNPSHYEGFGMQLLEAMHYKKKLLLSDIPIFHEVAGDYATYCNPSDEKGFVMALETALTNTEKQEAQIPHWSWLTNAQNIIGAITRLLGR